MLFNLWYQYYSTINAIKSLIKTAVERKLPKSVRAGKKKHNQLPLLTEETHSFFFPFAQQNTNIGRTHLTLTLYSFFKWTKKVFLMNIHVIYYYEQVRYLLSTLLKKHSRFSNAFPAAIIQLVMSRTSLPGSTKLMDVFSHFSCLKRLSIPIIIAV